MTPSGVVPARVAAPGTPSCSEGAAGVESGGEGEAQWARTGIQIARTTRLFQ